MKFIKKICIVLIFIILIFIIYLSYYKTKTYNKSKELFTKHILKENVKISNGDLINNVADDVYYKDNIIDEIILQQEYNYFSDNKSITGKVFIESNGLLYISNEIENKVYRLSNIKFNTIYYKSYNYDSKIYFYLISDNLDLYRLTINSADIQNSIVENMNIKTKVKNFTDLEITSDYYGSGSTLFILNQKNYIFDITSLLRYNDIGKSIYSKFFVFDDNTISNIYANMLTNKNGEYYKMKYFFVTEETVIEGNENKGIIITEDNKLIFLDDDNTNIYEYNSSIKNIDYDGGYPQVMEKLVITFDNNTKLTYNAACSNFYCINKEFTH